ncbi:tyrosine-type recombinase/integrase [Mycobacteroides abscessus subsp. massiliense]|nr:tyrosine-type recombinase/integrase [Mycobacteroides abscessus subsp. massiliense]
MTTTRGTGPAPLPAPPEWQGIIAKYRTAMEADGSPRTTIATRMSHLHRLARGLGAAPHEVTEETLTDWFAKQKHWQRETRRGYRTTTRGFFGWAHAKGHLLSNPAAGLETVAPEPPAPKPAPDRVWKESILAADARTMVMLYLACDAGLRRGEVAVVHTDDLLESFGGYMLVVHGKGGKERTIPISDGLADMVAAGPGGHTPGLGSGGYLFPGDDNGHLSPRWVGRLCANAMPGVWTMHKLRHRFATRAYRGTRDIRAVQELLGHSSVATTQLYTAVDDDEKRAAMMAASSGPPPLAKAARWAGSAVAGGAAAVTAIASAALLSDQLPPLYPGS